jgi:predicted NAD/FAD-binding protein
MLRFPASTLLRFFFNHGFLGLHTQHPWWTVDGGSREYVARLTRPFADRIRRGVGVAKIHRGPAGVELRLTDGGSETFEQVIVAAHGDQALQLLGRPTEAEARILGAFRYQPNVATLHTDASVMPRQRRAWASWNYRLSLDAEGRASPATHYWMNLLQGVSDRQNYFVTINHDDAIAPEKVVRRIAYRHPLFDLGAKKAQAEIPLLNAQALAGTRTFFVGAYQRYGFHEDGLQSAADLCDLLLSRNPWPSAHRSSGATPENHAPRRPPLLASR